jgi:hypothetical protein
MHEEVENLRSRHKQDDSVSSASSLSFATRLATNWSTRVMRYELVHSDSESMSRVYVTAGQSTHPSVEERNEMIVVRNREVNNVPSMIIQGCLCDFSEAKNQEVGRRIHPYTSCISMFSLISLKIESL